MSQSPELLNIELCNAYWLSVEGGLLAATATSQATDIICPTHGSPILLEQARTIGGWREALVCTSTDGPCAYDAHSGTKPTQGPALYVTKPAELDIVVTDDQGNAAAATLSPVTDQEPNVHDPEAELQK